MSFTFTPLSDEELDASDLMDDGIYDFEVVKSTKEISKAGNPQAKLQLKVWDIKGNVHTIFDYLVFTQIKLNLRKIKHFCESVGWAEKFAQGNLPEEMQMLCGKVQIGREGQTPKKDGSGFYPPKNVVIDYVSKGENTLSSVSSDEFNDDVPF